MSGLQIEHKREVHPIKWAIAGIFGVAIAMSIHYIIQWYNTGEVPSFVPIVSADPSIEEKAVSVVDRSTYSVDDPLQPRSLSIESLKVENARILRVGLTQNNLISMPKNVYDTGWYAKSSKPGAKAGAVVIVGHSQGTSSEGVFSRLNTMKAGEEIVVTTGNKKKHTYVVRSVSIIDLDDYNRSGVKQLLSSTDASEEGLNLMTNAGKWIPKLGVYDQRVIVRALRD